MVCGLTVHGAVIQLHFQKYTHNSYMVLHHTIPTWSYITQFLHGLTSHNSYMVLHHTIPTWSYITQFLHGLTSHNSYMVLHHTIPTWSYITQFLHGLTSHNSYMVLHHTIPTWSYITQFLHGLTSGQAGWQSFKSRFNDASRQSAHCCKERTTVQSRLISLTASVVTYNDDRIEVLSTCPCIKSTREIPKQFNSNTYIVLSPWPNILHDLVTAIVD